MRWATDIFGFTGNSELGIYQLSQYYERARGIPGLAEEAVLFTSLGYKLSWKDKEGFDFLAGQDEHLLSNTLVKYLYAMAATYTYRNDLALKLLAEIHQDRAGGDGCGEFFGGEHSQFGHGVS